MSWDDILKKRQLKDAYLELQDLAFEFEDVVHTLKDMAKEEIPKALYAARGLTNPEHIREVRKALQQIKEMDLFKLR